MMKRIVFICAVATPFFSSYGELNHSFDGNDRVQDIKGISRAKGAVTLESSSFSDANHILSLDKGAVVKFNTGLENKGSYSFSTDWKLDGVSTGLCFALADYNHNKKAFYFRVGGQGQCTASTYRSSKYKERLLFKAELDVWYRFNILVKGKKYSMVITNRGKRNDRNHGVVFDSLKAKKIFRMNPMVRSHIIFLNVWNGGGENEIGFDYDNIVLTER